VRTFSGTLVLLGFLALGWSMVSGPLSSAEAREARDDQAAAESPHSSLPTPHSSQHAWLHSAYVLAGIGGIGMFLLSFYALAMLPNREMEGQIERDLPTSLPSLSLAEERGRLIYGREGCVNCHTQLIRRTEDDVRRFGVASQAWEYERDFPHLWGTRRIGPDLARVKGRRTRDWHLAHLWNPRHVVPGSNMPGFPWLFTGSAKQPSTEALNLIAYLESLGRDADLAGLTQPSNLSGMDPEEERRLGMFCDCAIPRTPGPAPLLHLDNQPGERERLERRGSLVFQRECSGCHGPAGKGDGPAKDSLFILPRNLSTARFSNASLSKALWHGVPGSAMPGFHDLPLSDLRALVAFVQAAGPPKTGEPPLDAKTKSQAEALYQKHCVQCHGNQGQGLSAFATTIAPAPTAFRQVQPTLAYAEKVLADGVPGTAMIPWKTKLTSDERSLLARYVRAFFSPE
jgi:mono/diheme cytochrome c family protein